MELMWVMFGLILKHFIVDFPMQGPYMYKNKGTYGHPGGILHARYHAGGTLLILALSSTSTVLCILAALFDGLVHYHVDWAKTNINSYMGWGPTTHEEFWYLLGADQLLHYLTYFLIVWMFV